MTNIANNASEHSPKNLASLTSTHTSHSHRPSLEQVREVVQQVKTKTESAAFLLNHVNVFAYLVEGGDEGQATFLWEELTDCRDELAEASEIIDGFYKKVVEINN